MDNRDFEAEFEAIMAPVEADQSEESKREECLMYQREDDAFRLAIIKKISEFTGVKMAKEIYGG